MENSVKVILEECLNKHGVNLLKNFKFLEFKQLLTTDEIDKQYVGFRKEKIKLFEK